MPEGSVPPFVTAVSQGGVTALFLHCALAFGPATRTAPVARPTAAHYRREAVTPETAETNPTGGLRAGGITSGTVGLERVADKGSIWRPIRQPPTARRQAGERSCAFDAQVEQSRS